MTKTAALALTALATLAACSSGEDEEAGTTATSSAATATTEATTTPTTEVAKTIPERTAPTEPLGDPDNPAPIGESLADGGWALTLTEFRPAEGAELTTPYPPEGDTRYYASLDVHLEPGQASGSSTGAVISPWESSYISLHGPNGVYGGLTGSSVSVPCVPDRSSVGLVPDGATVTLVLCFDVRAGDDIEGATIIAEASGLNAMTMDPMAFATS